MLSIPDGPGGGIARPSAGAHHGVVTTAPPAARPAARPGPAIGRPGRFAALHGAAAGLLGIGLAELVAALLASPGSQLVAVGDMLIATLPGPLINFGKDVLGTADKPILLVIIAAVSLAVAALAGWLELRLRLAGLAPVA